MKIAMVLLFALATAAAAAQECPVCNAVLEGDSARIRQLINDGADPNERTVYKATPLMYAARHGKRSSALELMEHGADPDLQDGRGLTPLMIVALTCNNNRGGLVSELAFRTSTDAITARTNEGWTALGMAASRECFVAMEQILLPVNHISFDKTILTAAGPDGMTALHYAAAQGRVKNAEFILERAAHFNTPVIDAQTDDGATPLMFAAYHGHYAMLSLLVENGADGGIRDDNGVQAAFIANYRDPYFTYDEQRDERPYGYIYNRQSLASKLLNDNCGFGVFDYDDSKPEPPCGPLTPSLHDIEYKLPPPVE